MSMCDIDRRPMIFLLVFKIAIIERRSRLDSNNVNSILLARLTLYFLDFHSDFFDEY